MRKSKTIKLAGREITVNELTVRQIDELIAGIDADRMIQIVEMIINDHIPIEAVIASTGLTADDLAGDFTPSELRTLWDAVGEVNDFLSDLMVRMAAVGEKMSETNSAAPSAT